MLKTVKNLLLFSIFLNNFNYVEANITAVSAGIGTVFAASYEICSQYKVIKKEESEAKVQKKKKQRFHVTNQEALKKIVKTSALGGLIGGFTGYVISKKTTQPNPKSNKNSTSQPTFKQKNYSKPQPVYPQSNSNTKTQKNKQQISNSHPQNKVKNIKDTHLNTVELNEWWKSKNATKGGFVLPFFYEDGEKNYIIGSENYRAIGWCPFGGQCDSDETALECATREFWEESGVRGGHTSHSSSLNSNKKSILKKLMLDVDKKSRAENGDIFAICTNSDQVDKKPNLLIFYFVEWSKEEILNAFGNHDKEMTGFGIIKESDLKKVLLKGMNTVNGKNREAIKSFYSQQTGLVSLEKGSLYQGTDGLRDLMHYLVFISLTAQKLKNLKLANTATI